MSERERDTERKRAMGERRKEERGKRRRKESREKDERGERRRKEGVERKNKNITFFKFYQKYHTSQIFSHKTHIKNNFSHVSCIYVHK